MAFRNLEERHIRHHPKFYSTVFVQCDICGRICLNSTKRGLLSAAAHYGWRVTEDDKVLCRHCAEKAESSAEAEEAEQ